MIGCGFLYRISSALSKAKQCDKPFGGINVIFAGDFAQLSPVGDASLCTRVNTNRVSTSIGQNMVFGKLLWLSVTTVVMLTQVKRQDGSANAPFVKLLARLRMVRPQWVTSVWKTSPIIVSNNDAKDMLNARFAQAFADQTGQTLHWYYATD
ncbi:hypothetical protein EV361DRAFT_772197, partial [Lentinula raphanica]